MTKINVIKIVVDCITTTWLLNSAYMDDDVATSVDDDMLTYVDDDMLTYVDDIDDDVATFIAH